MSIENQTPTITVGIDMAIRKTGIYAIVTDYQGVTHHITKLVITKPLPLSTVEKYHASHTEVLYRPRIEPKEKYPNDLTAIAVAEINDAKRNAESIRISILAIAQCYGIENQNITVAIEGAAYSATGNVSQSIAIYRAVLIGELEEYWNVSVLSPTEAKKKAGKGNFSKEQMIEAAILSGADAPEGSFLRKMNEDRNFYMAKRNYVTGVDDIVDAYWLCRCVYDQKEKK